MPIYNVTLKPDAPESELEKAKQKAKDEGGKIQHEFTLIKGFTVEFDADKIHTLSTNEHLTVEEDAQVKIQPVSADKSSA